MDKRLEEIFAYGIKHYHEDVPYLLSIIRQQREALEAAKSELRDHHYEHPVMKMIDKALSGGEEK